MRSSDALRDRRRGGVVWTRVVLSAIVPLAIVLALAGCSSAPDAPDYEVAAKNRATQFSEYGNQHFAAGEYDLALRFFNLSLEENTSVDNLPGIAKSYNSIARVYSAAGDLEEARANVQLAMEFSDLADDSEQQMQAYINLGEVEMRDGDADAALAALERAQEIVNANEDLANAILLHNLGTLYARRDQFDRARQYLEDARAMNAEAGNWRELASNHYMLASIASRQEDYETARTHAEQALTFDKKAEYSPGIAADLQALGRISEHLQADEDAYQYYLRSLRVYLTVNDVSGSVAVLDALEAVARRTGRPDEADGFAAQRDRIREAVQ